jgi:hypothetical protein
MAHVFFETPGWRLETPCAGRMFVSETHLGMHFLTRLYPLASSWNQILKHNTFIGLFVGFFLIAFQPFNTHLWEAPYKNLLLAGYGLVSFSGATLAYAILFALYRPEQLERQWMIWKELVLEMSFLLLIALGNMLYSSVVIGFGQISAASLIQWLSVVALVGVIPIAVSILYKYERYTQLNQGTAQKLDRMLAQYHAPLQVSPDPVFVSENEKETFLCPLSDLLYLESADNYTCFVFLNEGKLQKRLLRGPLRRFEQQAEPHAEMVRCHRSYLVNLRQVHQVSGNAQGYRLHLLNGAVEIPVSRQYGADIVAALQQVSE